MSEIVSCTWSKKPNKKKKVYSFLESEIEIKISIKPTFYNFTLTCALFYAAMVLRAGDVTLNLCKHLKTGHAEVNTGLSNWWL